MSDLDETRAQLRRYLLPGSVLEADDDGGSHFPRSKVMRFAFNPRNRHLLTMSGSVLALLATRVVGGRAGAVAHLLRAVTRRKH